MNNTINNMKPLCMYKLNSVSKKNNTKGVTVYGKIKGYVSAPIRKKIYNDNGDKKWVAIELLGVSFNKTALYESLEHGYEYLAKGIESEHRVSGLVSVLIDTAELNGEIVGKFIKAVNGTWTLAYGKNNTYNVIRWKKDSNNEWCVEALTTKEMTQEELNRYSKCIENGGIIWLAQDANNPYSGVEGIMPERVAPNYNYVDSEYQIIPPPTESLQSNIWGVSGDIGIGANEGFYNSNGKEYGIDLTGGLFKKKRVYEDREEYIDIPKYNNLDEIIEYAKELKKNYFANIKNKVETSGDNLTDFFEELYKKIADNLKMYWRKKPTIGAGVKTGKAIFTEAVGKVLGSTYMKAKDDDISAYEMIEGLYGERLADIWCGREDATMPILHEIYSNRFYIYLAIYKDILKIRVDIVELARFSNISKALMLYILFKNPYLLVYLNADITLRDMDRLAMQLNSFGDTEQVKTRGIAVLVALLRGKGGRFFNEGSEVYSKTDINKKIVDAGVLKVNKYEYGQLEKNGSVLSDDALINFITYAIPKTKEKARNIKVYDMGKGWMARQDGTYSKKLVESIISDNIISDYISTGLGIEIKTNWYADLRTAEKACYVYNRLQEIRQTSGSANNKQDIIESRIVFQRIKRATGRVDFSLEEKQGKALELIHNSVLAVTGAAGCGKTTVAEALVFVMKQIYGYAAEDFLFIAPTGKAAKRLEKSLNESGLPDKYVTSTIHRAFRLGVSDKDERDCEILREEEKAEQVTDILQNRKVVIIDESSMIDLDLMYTILKRIPTEIKLIFLGDIEQLPPIRVGKPFSDILHFVPTVLLETVKRTEVGSMIALNAKKIAEGKSNISNGKDFKIVARKNEDIIESVKEMIVGLNRGEYKSEWEIEDIGAVAKEDIQIVTPYKSKKVKISTEVLNNSLQDIFNSYTGGWRIKIEGKEEEFVEYRVGDRVIHTENASKAKHLILEDGIVRVSETTRGVMNGDVGYIKDIICGVDLQFAPDDTETEKGFMISSDIYYIFVEYPDFLTGDTFMIAYSVKKYSKMGNEISSTPISIDLDEDVEEESMNLVLSADKIELAFALTVHKMQGSQSKIIIFVLPETNSTGILTKNLLYTGITRGEKGVILVGDINNIGNIVKKDAMEYRTSVLDILQ